MELKHGRLWAKIKDNVVLIVLYGIETCLTVGTGNNITGLNRTLWN